jgi:hypothetical protein
MVGQGFGMAMDGLDYPAVLVIDYRGLEYKIFSWMYIQT